MTEDPFKEYLKEEEPGKKEKANIWSTAIGLQDVDGLKVSPYLLSLASRHIEGDISFEEISDLLRHYYEDKPDIDRTEEADEVSERIAMLLSSDAFSFSVAQYISIHQKLFRGIYPHAGAIRDYNITKKEWVLNEDTVYYAHADDIIAALEYDFSEERKFSYAGLSEDEIISHLASFVSRIWQIHPFGEGNTRTTAVFFIKYLRTLGYKADNDIFAKNAWYFRNALVRANYSNLKFGINETTEYLELFLRNLLLNENHPLQNRTMHISGAFKTSEKVNIDTQKVNIDTQKVNIQELFAPKTSGHIIKLHEEFGYDGIFGRSDIQRVLGLKPTRCSLLLKDMMSAGLLEPVMGRGKGKYRFKRHS